MAIFCYKDAYLSINGTDLSDHVQECSCNFDAEMLDRTVMGDDWRSFLPGLKNWEITVTFAQDYASGKVDATLWSLLGATAFPIVFKPNGSTTSSTNPKFTGNAVLANYNPIGGAVGDLAKAQVTLKAGDGDGLTRATSD